MPNSKSFIDSIPEWAWPPLLLLWAPIWTAIVIICLLPCTIVASAVLTYREWPRSPKVPK